MGTLSRPARVSRQPATAQSTSPISLHFPTWRMRANMGSSGEGLGRAKMKRLSASSTTPAAAIASGAQRLGMAGRGGCTVGGLAGRA